MSELPNGWAITDIQSIATDVVVGFVGTSKTHYRDSGVPFLTGKNIKSGKIDLRKIDYITNEFHQKEKKSNLSPGDVVVVRIGRSGEAAVIPESLQDANCGGLVVIKKPLAILPELLSNYLNSPSAIISSQLEARGATRQTLNTKNIAEKKIPVPPLAEQTRIAAKLDELLAQVDTLKARIDGIPALLKRFRQSVLAAAVSGRLTEEWRAQKPVSESAEEYLEKVLRSRRESPIVKFKEPLLPDLEKGDIDAPEGWIVSSVSSFSECLDSMRVPVKKELRVISKGRYPYFGANGEVDRVDEYIFDNDLVLVTEDETFYGREKPIAYKYSGKCWINNHVHALRAHDPVARDYLCYALMHYDVTPWLTGTTGRAKLTQGALLSLPIRVPPPAEQAEIVRRVEQLFAFADQLEARVKAAQTRIDRLTQSILAKAFRGELVPQDPNDEPASVLLARIKAQRAAAPKAKRGRGAAKLS